KSSSWTATAAMSTFVLLWGSAAIFLRWGLDHGSVFALLILRYALALGALLVIGLPGRNWLPKPGTRWQVAGTGLLLIGGYSVCYILAGLLLVFRKQTPKARGAPIIVRHFSFSASTQNNRR